MKAYIQQKYDDHRRRIKNAKSTIDPAKPPDMPMSMRREAERRREQASIEKDNRLLLDRLAVAMSHKNIDNKLKEKPFTSYMELQRKKELKKIMTENDRMLGRIQQTVPSYRHVEWELDAEKRVEYLRNMTEFPELFVPPGSSMKSRKESRLSGSGSKSHGRTGEINHEIFNNSPFRSNHDQDDENMVPQPPQPYPMEQNAEQLQYQSKRIQRPLILPSVKNK